MNYRIVRVALALALGITLFAWLPAQSAPLAPTAQPSTISYWGMNVYLTKRERVDNIGANDNLDLLATSARNAGVAWTLEEFPWDLIEPANNNFNTVYDASIKKAADNGLGIIGMLLTTPQWARDGSCSGNYWCPPANVAEYAQFAGWMAERYDGDGLNDAPGSPRVAAWQIWNEPNDVNQWPLITGGEAARRLRYGQMLVAAYDAIKAADPTATVVLGGVYIFDGGNGDGLDFLNGTNGALRQVPAAKNKFDVFGIHPYMPTIAPDAVNIISAVVLEGRLSNARNWLTNDIGRATAPIWITEIGWCTSPGSGGCPQVSDLDQARYIIRAMVIAQQYGIQHTNWLQLEDAFDGGHAFSGSAIVNNLSGNSYGPKPAYLAYQTMATLLSGTLPAGAGPLHSHTFTFGFGTFNTGGIYDYRYSKNTTLTDVLWVPSASQAVSFPLDPAKQALFYTRNGQQFTPAIANNTASLTLSDDPIFVVQKSPPSLVVSQSKLYLLAEQGQTTAASAFSVANGSQDSSFSWSATNLTPAWLSLSPASGLATSTPTTVVLGASLSGLGLGTHTGSFTVNAGSVGSQTIQVELNIVAALQHTYLPLVTR
jgi:hypothetical protein